MNQGESDCNTFGWLCRTVSSCSWHIIIEISIFKANGNGFILASSSQIEVDF